MNGALPIRNALVSVFDKTGLEPLCRALAAQGVQFFSTGGTAKFLESLGLKVTSVESLTQFPEMMDGRVKTLHPKVFGGILARREAAEDLSAAKEHGIALFDLVVVNLYPFAEHRAAALEEQTKYIDIGGPSMLRAAAKNSSFVAVLSDPTDYPAFLDHFAQNQAHTTSAFRHTLAAGTFSRTSAYDAMISEAWSKNPLPSSLLLSPQQPLRYGENPHQNAAWVDHGAGWKVLQGKELSYNNLLDAEAATRLTSDFETGAVAIIKHGNPCGVASGPLSTAQLFERALCCDPTSAFGGIVSCRDDIDETAAKAMSALFLEVIIAPHFSEEAKALLSQKKNLRLIEWEKPRHCQAEVRAAMGGWLIQESDTRALPEELQTVTKTPVPEDAWDDLRLAWITCKHVRSNAIVISSAGSTVGIGAGQMSRVGSVKIALEKAGPDRLKNAVLASDAFFPFRDNIDSLKGTGIRAIIQPGGSQKDAEVIDAANEAGIAMVFTGERHFRH